MFKTTTELFCENDEETICYGIISLSDNIHVPLISTDINIVLSICKKLNSAKTNKENLLYIIEDLVTDLYIKTA